MFRKGGDSAAYQVVNVMGTGELRESPASTSDETEKGSDLTVIVGEDYKASANTEQPDQDARP
jgi:hypothetical protein